MPDLAAPTSTEEPATRRRLHAPWRVVRSILFRLAVQVAIDFFRDLW